MGDIPRARYAASGLKTPRLEHGATKAWRRKTEVTAAVIASAGNSTTERYEF